MAAVWYETGGRPRRPELDKLPQAEWLHRLISEGNASPIADFKVASICLGSTFSLQWDHRGHVMFLRTFVVFVSLVCGLNANAQFIACNNSSRSIEVAVLEVDSEGSQRAEGWLEIRRQECRTLVDFMGSDDKVYIKLRDTADTSWTPNLTSSKPTCANLRSNFDYEWSRGDSRSCDSPLRRMDFWGPERFHPVLPFRVTIVDTPIRGGRNRVQDDVQRADRSNLPVPRELRSQEQSTSSSSSGQDQGSRATASSSAIHSIDVCYAGPAWRCGVGLPTAIAPGCLAGRRHIFQRQKCGGVDPVDVTVLSSNRGGECGITWVRLHCAGGSPESTSTTAQTSNEPYTAVGRIRCLENGSYPAFDIVQQSAANGASCSQAKSKVENHFRSADRCRNSSAGVFPNRSWSGGNIQWVPTGSCP